MKTQQVLHILHLTDGNRGGSQRHIIDLCRAGMPGIRHFVLRVAGASASLHDAARDRMLVFDLPAGPDSLPALLSTVIAELGIDCLHAHSLPVLLAARGAAPDADATPFVVTLHDLGCIAPDLFTAPGAEPRPDAKWIARCAPHLRAARTVIVPSAYLAGLVAAHYPGVAPTVVANGIGPAPGGTLPIAPPWPAGRRVYAVVGALGPHKGSETLLRVAAALRDPAIVGVIIGYTEAQLTPGWIVPGRLYVHGRYEPDELPALLAAYGVLLAYFPNLVPESFSYVLSEVWQAGIPALVPDRGALGERMRTAGAGWLLDDPQDAAKAATTIARLLAPAGVAALEAARAKLRPPADCVPGLPAMRAAIESIYRSHAAGPAGAADGRRDGAADGGWVRLRYGLRPTLLAGADDCALDAEGPARVHEERTLREWNGKLAADIRVLEDTSQRTQAELAAALSRANQLESDAARLKERNQRVEADAAALAARNRTLEDDRHAQLAHNDELEGQIAALSRRNVEVEDAVVALKARNRQVEADAAGLALRNARIEADIVALKARNDQQQGDIDALLRRNVQLEGDTVALLQRNIELDSDVVALKERNTLVEAGIVALKERNARVEHDAAQLQADLAAAAQRATGLEAALAAERERAARFERALAHLPTVIQNWLLRHAR